MRTYKVFRTKKAVNRPYRRPEDGNYPAGTVVIKVIEKQEGREDVKWFLVSETGIMNNCTFKVSKDYSFWNKVVRDPEMSEWQDTFKDGDKEHEEFIEQYTKEKMYYSKSRGGYIFISEMPDGHLRNAIEYNRGLIESRRKAGIEDDDGMRRAKLELIDMKNEMNRREKEQKLLKEMDKLMETKLAQKWLRVNGYMKPAMLESFNLNNKPIGKFTEKDIGTFVESCEVKESELLVSVKNGTIKPEEAEEIVRKFITEGKGRTHTFVGKEGQEITVTLLSRINRTLLPKK